MSIARSARPGRLQTRRCDPRLRAETRGILRRRRSFPTRHNLEKCRLFQAGRETNFYQESQNPLGFARPKIASARQTPCGIACQSAKLQGFARRRWDPRESVQNAKPSERSTDAITRVARYGVNSIEYATVRRCRRFAQTYCTWCN
jgi:hypothetical protein